MKAASNRRRRSARLSLLSIVLALGGSACHRPPSGEDAAVISWVRQQLVPVELDSLEGGLAGLSSALGPIRLVGIGESRHDTRELPLLKTALVRQLIEQEGFRLLFLEESAAHAYALDDYVRGLTDDLDDALQRLAGWYLFDVEEMRPLLRWMRDFNASRPADDQVRVSGVDITAPAPAVRRLIAHLAESPQTAHIDAEALGLDLFDGDFWPQIAQRFAALAPERRRELEKNYTDLAALLEVELEAHDPAHRDFDIAQRSVRFSLADDLAAAGDVRERSMAALVLQAMDDLPDARGIYWSANLHVATGAFRMPAMAERAGLAPDTAFTPAGAFLRERLGDAYLAIGSSFASGRFGADLPPGERSFPTLTTNTLDGMFAAAHSGSFWLDLRDPPADAAAWLGQQRVWRAQDAEALVSPAEAVQLILHVHEISRSRPSAAALQRFLELPSG